MLPTLLLLALFPASTPAQPTPTAYYSFEQGLDGVGVAGALPSTVGGKPELVPGKVGRGLKVGPTYGYLDCPTAGVIGPMSGTVEMWVRPLDWSSDDGKFHVFFDTRGQGVLYLYEYFNTERLLMLMGPDMAGPLTNAQLPTDFSPGEWHHIAGTWSPEGVQAYYDGKPAGVLPAKGQLPGTLGETFRLGDEPWQFERESGSVIDEVRLYDRALSPAHIAAHAAGDMDFTVPLAQETTALWYDIDCLSGTAAVTVTFGGADVEDGRLQARVALVEPGTALPVDASAVPVQTGKAQATVAVPVTQPGTYELLAEVLLDGRPQFSLRRELIVPTTEWLGNQIGLEDRVLPPWTPVQVEGTTLKCWGREYRFDNGLLPTQIVAKDRPLLAAPVALNIQAGGEQVKLEEQEAELQQATPTRARLQARATAELAGERVTFRSDVLFEYDGLALVELTCDRPEQVPLERLSVEIPIADEHALYQHRYLKSWVPDSGLLPEGQGVLIEEPFIPYAWLGDNDRGLFWFCESDEMWPNGAAEDAVEIAREGGRVVLRLNILGPEQRLPENWKLVFGLQATPVKPLPPDRRKWRMTETLLSDEGRRRQNIQIIWPVPDKEDSLAAFGWPQARDEAVFAARIEALHAKGALAVPYLCLTWVADNTPQWRFFRKQWEMKASDPSIPQAGWDHNFELVSPVAPGYSDFIIWTTRRFMEKYHIDGTYHDQTHPYTSSNTISGVGYKRDGKEHISYPILGYRALYRRNYAMVKSLPWQTWTQAHMSGKMVVPVLAYDDTYLDGEHFRGVVKDSYMDVCSLAQFRAEYMGRQWGLCPVFLPEFDDEHRKAVEPTRGLMALLMIHDIGIWPIWCNARVVEEALTALDDFGFVESEFIPYFDPTPPATTDLADVVTSAYRKDNGEVLLVVANLSKEDRRGQVEVNLEALGVPQAKAESWPERQALESPRGRLTLEIPRLGYRLVRLTGR